MTYAEVAVNAPVEHTYHYRVPLDLEGSVRPGSRVRVSFGRQTVAGYCVGLAESCPIPPERVKPILRVLDETPLLDGPMLSLTRWIAEEYVCGWGEALEAALPAGVRRRTRAASVVLVEGARPAAELRARADAVAERAPRQAAALRLLADAGDMLLLSELAAETGATAQTVHVLEKQGWVRTRRQTVSVEAAAGLEAHRTDPLPPTPDQARALEAIRERLRQKDPGVVLLYGVTGSGKTEVYLQALQTVIEAGRQGIVLVPEIALTPQTVRRFAGRFGRVALLHSRLTEAERRAEWHRIQAGEADVVIGARSAVFAPARRLGMIVVDEAHETSFKQQSAPRYHAVSVAVRRAREAGALVLLGSATPALEDYHRALTGEYTLVRLPRRVADAPMPGVEIVDMRAERADRKRFTRLSRRLVALMKAGLARGEQVILFLNRRGFSTFVTCRRCGYVLTCEQCDVSLVYHRKSGATMCHYCGRQVAPPEFCPVCNSPAVSYLGAGTQRIEQIIAKQFPGAVCARMDSDSTRSRTSHGDILAAFREGRAHILLGTQMIAKGLDFPNVTVVGVIDADVSLNLPDFRASERTFQLLAQVAGRTGRGFRGGRVVVQTCAPEQACIQLAARHDFTSFAEHELEHRRRMGYPPFGRLARLVFESKDEARCEERAAAVGERLRREAEAQGVHVLGPVPPPLAKVRGVHRRHIVLKEVASAEGPAAPGATPMSGEPCRTSRGLHGVLHACREEFRPRRGVQAIVDVDPVGMA